MSNRLSKLVKKIGYAPKSLQPWLLTKLFCSQVKYANTTGIHITEISDQQVVIELANKKRVQNHIGGIHAVAAALLAESATGIAFGIHLPDSKIPLIKSMKLDYVRRMQGALVAKATITEVQKHEIQTKEKGDMEIAVTITDESNQQPIECHMQWAWITKKARD